MKKVLILFAVATLLASCSSSTSETTTSAAPVDALGVEVSSTVDTVTTTTDTAVTK